MDRTTANVRRVLLYLLLILASGCATRTPLSTPVPFAVHGRVVTRDGKPISHAHVHLSEENSRLFPLAIARSRNIGNTVTRSDGSFSIKVTSPLQSERLSLLVVGRTYNVVGSTLANQYTQTDDSVFTESVRVPGPNIIRVHSGFIPGPARVTVQKLPRF
jgi:hypothetical protein